jgi:hypothetical protein
MERGSRVARDVALASGALGTVASALLSTDGGWWALGRTLTLVGWSLCALAATVWVALLLGGKRRGFSAWDRVEEAAARTERRQTPALALPETARRREIERLTDRITITRREWDRLQEDLRKLEARRADDPRGAGPGEFVRLGHLRALDAEYRSNARHLNDDLTALSGMRPAA